MPVPVEGASSGLRRFDVLVLGAGEQLPAELRERREAERPEQAVGVHVLHPLVDVVGPWAQLVEGGFDPDACTIECPRHGSLFDITTGKPKTLPAYVPVDTFTVIIEDETIKLEVE